MAVAVEALGVEARRSGGVYLLADLLRHAESDRPAHPAPYLLSRLLRTHGGMRLSPDQLPEFLDGASDI